MTKPQFPADLVTFTEEILNGKLHFFVQCLLERNIAFLKNFSQKVDVVQKYLLGKSSSSVDVFILNNSSAKMVAFPKINYPKELSILKKWLLGGSFTLEK